MNMDIQFERKIKGDRRIQPRYKLAGDCIGKVKVKVNPQNKWYSRSYKAILLDFSRNGVNVTTPKRLNLNDKVEITFSNNATVSATVKNIKKLMLGGKAYFSYGLYLHDKLSISLFRWLGVDNIECSNVVDGRACTCQQICRYGLEVADINNT